MLVGAALLCVTGRVAAQQPSLTLREAVEQAVAKYPGVTAAEADRDAATATIEVAREAYRPRIDGLLQLNRATHSNVAGLLFPQSVIAPISGPVFSDHSGGSVWGTAVGALVSWKPFDFGARGAAVRAAQQSGEAARFSAERVKLDTAVITADAYLSALAATVTVSAAQAAVDRAAILTRTVDALVNAGLRPGVDAASAKAEQAAAEMQILQARRAEAAAHALLAQYVGTSIHPVALPAPPIPVDAITPSTPDQSPVVKERQAAVDEAATRLGLAHRSADPEVALQGSVYARGTGVLADNSSASGTDGLGLDTSNWAVGITVTIPVMEWANKHARETVQASHLKAAAARRDEAALDLARRREVAQQDTRLSLDLMRQVPAVVSAARDAHAQATARYQAGLLSITDVADAQRRLAQAEIDAALVALAAWRAHLDWDASIATSAEDFAARISPRP